MEMFDIINYNMQNTINYLTEDQQLKIIRCYYEALL